MFHGFDDKVKPEWLHPMNKVYGINWKANVATAGGIVKGCNSKYASFGALVKVVDRCLATLEGATKDEDDWSDAECVNCLKLLTSGLIGVTSYSHMFHHLCWSNHRKVLCMGSLSHVQDQCNGTLLWFPLGWRENDLVILNIRVKQDLTLSSVNIYD